MIDVIVMRGDDYFFRWSMWIVRTFIERQTIFDFVGHIVGDTGVAIGLGCQRISDGRFRIIMSYDIDTRQRMIRNMRPTNLANVWCIGCYCWPHWPTDCLRDVEDCHWWMCPHRAHRTRCHESIGQYWVLTVRWYCPLRKYVPTPNDWPHHLVDYRSVTVWSPLFRSVDGNERSLATLPVRANPFSIGSEKRWTAPNSQVIVLNRGVSCWKLAWIKGMLYNELWIRPSSM